MPEAPLYAVTPEEMRISMPHLLIWGSGDQALLPACHSELDAFCDDLEKHVIPAADHWILHTHGAAVAGMMRAFLYD